ncbi:MAG: AraC family transcriptional regulator [Tannerellaceae bacterium]|nr:AraC family transcriptional regulator [Tannerellaceae bacterium]
MGEPNFKNLILKHYKHINSVAELAVIAGMSRTIFDNKFKEVFGMSARKWILQETAKQVRFRAKQPNVTITDLMDEFKFNSATHFNRFCKQYFDCTPGELIRRSRNR